MTAKPSVRIAAPDGRTPVLIDWSISSFSRWGIHALNLALVLSGHPGFYPILARPVARADCILDPLRQAAIDRLAAGASDLWDLLPALPQEAVETDAPVLLRLGSDLVPRPGSGDKMLSGQPGVGMAFLEHATISPEARTRASRFPLIIAGSRWTEHVLRTNGIVATTTVLQGVDTALFHPAPGTGRFRDRFVIFSGGGAARRCGHDFVLNAFRQFHRRHREALLMTAWRPPGSGQTGPSAGGPDDGGDIDPAQWAQANGVPADALVCLGPTPNIAMPHVLREADLGLFPSRCEGGTNPDAMECMACGVPVILSANTGHLDLLEASDVALALTRQTAVGQPGLDAGGWGESDVEEILDRLEQVWTDRSAATALGLRGSSLVSAMTTAHQTERLMRAILPLLP